MCIYYILYTIYYILYTTYYILYTIYYILYTIYIYIHLTYTYTYTYKYTYTNKYTYSYAYTPTYTIYYLLYTINYILYTIYIYIYILCIERHSVCIYIYIITISPPYFLTFTHQAAHVAGLIRLEPRDRWLCRRQALGDAIRARSGYSGRLCTEKNFGKTLENMFIDVYLS